MTTKAKPLDIKLLKLKSLYHWCDDKIHLKRTSPILCQKCPTAVRAKHCSTKVDFDH